MSTLGYNGLGRFATEEIVPDWYKCERYEYCEPFFHNKDEKDKNRRKFYPLHMLLSLFF